MFSHCLAGSPLVKIKNIRLTEDPAEVECRVDGSVIVLKTVFLKKA